MLNKLATNLRGQAERMKPIWFFKEAQRESFTLKEVPFEKEDEAAHEKRTKTRCA